MSFYLSQFITYLLLPAFLSGLLYSTNKSYTYKQQTFISLAGIFAGVTFFLILPWQQKWILIVASIALVTYSITLLYGFFSLARRKKQTNYYIGLFYYLLPIIHFLLFFCASYFWARNGQLSMLTNTTVINTDMVLNSLMPIVGFTLVTFVSLSLQSIIKLPPILHTLLIIVVSIIAILPLSGEWMLVVVKLNSDLLELFNLSYIAKVNYYIWAYPYFIILFFTAIVIYYWYINLEQIKNIPEKTIDPINYRILLAKKNKVYNNIKRLFVLILSLVSVLLWWDLVASKPIERSEATEVKLSQNKEVSLNIKEQHLDDGDLHRYSWIASDGKEVRFFIIRRYPDQDKYGVVFDSCMLCGDAGYAKQGNNVVCLACGVHIFVPSIGRKGGCNPIPITEWRQTDDAIIIPQKSLEEGLRYFSTIHSIDVVDPVNGKHLINTEAEYQYQYGTKAYFFTDKESYDTFRNDPLSYIDIEE